jgi:hypothetical protein
MADESPPAPPPPYMAAPPPPAGYPAPAYPNWQTNPPPQYRGPMLPGWLTFGGILILVGGILVLVGFMVDLVGVASLSATSTLSSQQAYMETYDALVGVGIFLAVLGWLFHQMSMSRRMGH